MKTAITIILVIASFFTTVLWSCCCAASKVNKQTGMKDRSEVTDHAGGIGAENRPSD